MGKLPLSVNKTKQLGWDDKIAGIKVAQLKEEKEQPDDNSKDLKKNSNNDINDTNKNQIGVNDIKNASPTKIDKETIKKTGIKIRQKHYREDEEPGQNPLSKKYEKYDNIFFWLPQLPDVSKQILKNIDKKTADRRMTIAKEAIKAYSIYYEFPTRNLNYWITGKDGIKWVAKSEFDFEKSGLSYAIMNKPEHMASIAKGLLKRLNAKKGEPYYIPRGSVDILYRQDTLKAEAGGGLYAMKKFLTSSEKERIQIKKDDPALERYCGVGGVYISSEIVIKKIGERKFKMLSWRYQVFDIYNFVYEKRKNGNIVDDLETKAKLILEAVPVFVHKNEQNLSIIKSEIDYILNEEDGIEEINNKEGAWIIFFVKAPWFNELETFGQPKQYEIFSEIYDGDINAFGKRLLKIAPELRK